MAGRVWVDAVAKPLSAIVGHVSGFHLAFGEGTDALLWAGLEVLGRIPTIEPGVLWATSDSWDRAITESGMGPQERHEFAPPRTGSDSTPAPEGYRLESLDLNAVRQIEERIDDWIVRAWGGAEAFCAGSFGVGAYAGEELVAFCAACAVSRESEHAEAEIEIVTAPDHRGRGLGFAAASAFIGECRTRGLAPSWSCAAENVASRRLAEKLGFVFLRRIRGVPIPRQ